jgi:hypothetical protein
VGFQEAFLGCEYVEWQAVDVGDEGWGKELGARRRSRHHLLSLLQIGKNMVSMRRSRELGVTVVVWSFTSVGPMEKVSRTCRIL